MGQFPVEGNEDSNSLRRVTRGVYVVPTRELHTIFPWYKIVFIHRKYILQCENLVFYVWGFVEVSILREDIY